MSEIKPIETRYKGYRFRSRLEARWAVFFDALKIRWEYEPQGFKIVHAWEGGIDGGPPPRRGSEEDPWLYLPDFFLPDFFLPDFGTWVEVKGSLDNLPQDYFDMVGWAVDWGGQLPGVGDSLGSTRGLLWLGPIPDFPAGTVGRPPHVILQHSKGGFFADCRFDIRSGLIVSNAGGYYFDASWPAGADIKKHLLDQIYPCRSWFKDGCHPGLQGAYGAARSARFAHGETPK